MAQTFFGLEPSDREDVILEPFFNLGYYFGLSWTEYYSMPITYRRWLMLRLNKELKQSAEQGKPTSMPSKGIQHNDPSLRSLMGRRPFASHKNRNK